jgi:hypothetical protein
VFMLHRLCADLACAASGSDKSRRGGATVRRGGDWP